MTAAVFRKALAVNAATLAATGSGRVQVGDALRWVEQWCTSCARQLLHGAHACMPNHHNSIHVCSDGCLYVCLFPPAQTLMSVDADRLVNLCISFHDLWSLPAQIGIALWLLYTQVHVLHGVPVFCIGSLWFGVALWPLYTQVPTVTCG